MKSVSLCLRRLIVPISIYFIIRIYITSQKMHISDLKEIYFEKAVCKAKHTYIHTSTHDYFNDVQS